MSDGLGGYPAGAQYDSRAPWNQRDDDNPEVTVSVVVTVSLSKVVEIKTSDYIIEDEGPDEDGTIYRTLDFSNTDFEREVKEQIILPQDASLYIDIGANPKAAKDLSDWKLEDIECYKEGKYHETY